MHLAVGRVGIDMECLDAYGIGMHPKCVFLRIVDHHRIVGSIAVSRFLVIHKPVARHFVTVGLIHIDYIPVAFAHAILLVIIQAVGCDILLLVDHC